MTQSSFPFLQIAKQFDLPYERVLNAAEKFRSAVAVSRKFGRKFGSLGGLSPLDTIENAVAAENKRRALIELKQH